MAPALGGVVVGDDVLWIRQGEDVQGPFPREHVVAWVGSGRLRDPMLLSADARSWVLVSDAYDVMQPPRTVAVPAVPVVPEPIERIPSVRQVQERPGRAPRGRRGRPRVAASPRGRQPGGDGARGGLPPTTVVVLAVSVLVVGVAVGVGLQSSDDSETRPADPGGNAPADRAGAGEGVQALVARVEGAVALIRDTAGSGTGFLVARGVVATNAHVVDGMGLGRIEVSFPARGRRTYAVKRLLHFDEERDLCLLEVAASGEPLPIALGGDPARGAEVVIIGNPGMGDGVVVENAVTRGLMGPSTVVDGHRYLQVSASVNPGNSGGPVLNAKGEVIAMVTIRAAFREGIAFGIPALDIRAAYEAAARSSASELTRVNDQFRLTSAFRRIEMAGDSYLRVMEAYIAGLRRALRSGVRRIDGSHPLVPDLSDAVQRIQEASGDDLSTCLDFLYERRAVDRKTRENLLDFHQTVVTLSMRAVQPDLLKIYLYLQEHEALTKRFATLRVRLRARLGLPDEE